MIADPDALSGEVEQRVFVTDYEGVPWPSQSGWHDGELRVAIDFDESCYLQLPWPSEFGHEIMLSTATLGQRDKPYILTLELLRGTLHRAINQISDWQTAGFSVADENLKLLSEVRKILATAATCGHRPGECSRLATEGLRIVIQLVYSLGNGLTEQLSKARSTVKAATLRAANLQGYPLPSSELTVFRSAFDSAVVSVRWRDIESEPNEYVWTTVTDQIESVQAGELRVIAGPLLSLENRTIPDWLYLWEEDHETVVNNAVDFVSQVVGEYKGRVQLWHAASGMNCARGLGLDEESRLRLAASAINAVRQRDAQTPVMVSFEQPWGEYLSRRHYDLSPLGFADALVRAELGLSALGLELNLDYWPGGTVRRDLFEVMRKLDQWAQFNLPLVVFLTAPSDAPSGDTTYGSSFLVTHRHASQATQQQVAERWVPLIGSHPAVHGVVWNQWTDQHDGGLPYAGLLDRSGQRKTALIKLQRSG